MFRCKLAVKSIEPSLYLDNVDDGTIVALLRSCDNFSAPHFWQSLDLAEELEEKNNFEASYVVCL